MRWQPALRVAPAYFDQPSYVEALAESLEEGVAKLPFTPDVIIASFHGMPEEYLHKGDPYYCQCAATTRLLRERLGRDDKQLMMTFQSRFGTAEWLKPYTQDTVVRLARDGVARVDVVCPGFVSDCLETLEEIGIEVKQAFLGAGGREFHAIPCLNEHPYWIAALTDLVLANLQGWLDAPPDAAAREATLMRAKAMGARQ